MELKDKLDVRRSLIEKTLLEELQEDKEIDRTLHESMKYSLMAGGKRLRPMMLMAAADAVGGNGDSFVKSACAMEMIHTYSLIHDDLPAMDNDDLRRGKPTNHKVFGDAIAILAGDGLLTMAFQVLTRQTDVAPEKMIAVIREISDAAGSQGMVGGQALDLEAENRRIDADELRKMHMGKTGALFRAAVRSGAILGGADDEMLERLTTYAENFGLAFQITDDILDYEGDEALIGKPVGSDERNHKSTYVTLFSLEKAHELAREAVDNAMKALDCFDEKADFLRYILKALINRKN